MAFAAPFLAHDDQRRLVQASAKRQFVQPIQHRPLWRVSPFDDEGHCIGEIDQIGAIDQNLQWRRVQHDDIELLPGAGDELREIFEERSSSVGIVAPRVPTSASSDVALSWVVMSARRSAGILPER